MKVPSPPRVLGHQIVATVQARGEGTSEERTRDGRVGVPWLGWTDGVL